MLVMDDAVWRPILCCGGGVLIIIKDVLNAFPTRQHDLHSGVSGERGAGGPAAGGSHNEELTQPAPERLQGHDTLLQSSRSSLRAGSRAKHKYSHGSKSLQNTRELLEKHSMQRLYN